ncbi:MAG TPA: DUF6766 family protein [Polyangiaceae bacterium]|nr:DUF6766 family protein [Polyangiaceae bacterium]
MATQTVSGRPGAGVRPSGRASERGGHEGGASKRWLRENGLTIALLAFFFASLVGQGLAGYRLLNEELAEHGQAALSFGAYLISGHFIESVFENWESEFLQMAAFVLFTVWLRQKGSPESNPLEEKAGAEGGGAEERSAEAPWPVRRGGLVKAVYSHSLTIALTLLFLGSFALHAAGGVREHNREQALHGGGAASFFEYLGTSKFWFQSFQNWQSEFFSVAVLVVLTVFLREKGSAQSKEVAAPHRETGE